MFLPLRLLSLPCTCCKSIRIRWAIATAAGSHGREPLAILGAQKAKFVFRCLSQISSLERCDSPSAPFKCILVVVAVFQLVLSVTVAFQFSTCNDLLYLLYTTVSCRWMRWWVDFVEPEFPMSRYHLQVNCKQLLKIHYFNLFYIILQERHNFSSIVILYTLKLHQLRALQCYRKIHSQMSAPGRKPNSWMHIQPVLPPRRPWKVHSLLCLLGSNWTSFRR